MKKHKKKFKVRRLIIFVVIIILSIYLYIKYNSFVLDAVNKDYNIVNQNLDTDGFAVIKLDKNNKYNGIGQEVVKDKDGYFTTFTTIENNKKIYKEYKQNGNSSWSEKYYWGGTMADNGCGITSMAIILSGYKKNYTPEYLRTKYFPKLDGNEISSKLTGFGIQNSDFLYDTTHLSNDYIENHLKTNRPILICVWNKPIANRWTTTSHYMVLLAYDNNNMVYVSNPNGLENNSKSSGWYDINEVTPYVAKALFIEKY